MPEGAALGAARELPGVATPQQHQRARDCKACEKAAKIRASARAPVLKVGPMQGVDIDAIHFKLGAVKPGVRPRP